MLEFSESDLRSFCRELKFDTLTTTRIIKGIKATLKENANGAIAPAAPDIPQSTANNNKNILPPMMESDIFRQISGDRNVNQMDIPQNAEPIAQNNNSVQHIIVSPQEHDAMEKMTKRLSMTLKLSKEIETSQDAIDESTKLAKSDLKEKFTLLFEQMKLRQEELMGMIDELNAFKKKALSQQSEQLNAYKTHIAEVKPALHARSLRKKNFFLACRVRRSMRY